MTHSVGHIPEGFHSVTPSLTVHDAEAAIAFYQQAFGARETLRLVDPSGTIVHAEVRIGDTVVSLTEENPDYRNHSPKSLGGTPVLLSLYVEDVDALAERAVAAGAEIVIPVGDQFYGDRSGRLKDPFGHLWIIATHTEDMSAAEMQRRLDALMDQQAETG